MASRTIRLFCTAAILFLGPLAGVLVAVALFIATGVLLPGEPMYVGSSTPSLDRVLVLALLALVATTSLIYARQKLGGRGSSG